jgi:hypothetical protein
VNVLHGKLMCASLFIWNILFQICELDEWQDLPPNGKMRENGGLTGLQLWK